MNRARPLLAPLLLLATACGPELPPGWEDAKEVSDFDQALCAGSPFEEFQVTLSAERTAGDALRVGYSNAHYRCEQDLTAFWREDEGGVGILVQPLDLHPSMVAGCDCLYDLTMSLPAPGEGGTVTVFRRWDALNEPNDPVRVGEASF